MATIGLIAIRGLSMLLGGYVKGTSSSLVRQWCLGSMESLTSGRGRHDEEVQFYAFDMLAGDGNDLRSLSLSLRKTNLARLLARRSEGIFIAPFEQGEIGPDLFRAACNMGLEGLVSGTDPTGLGGRRTG